MFTSGANQAQSIPLSPMVMLGGGGYQVANSEAAPSIAVSGSGPYSQTSMLSEGNAVIGMSQESLVQTLHQTIERAVNFIVENVVKEVINKLSSFRIPELMKGEAALAGAVQTSGAVSKTSDDVSWIDSLYDGAKKIDKTIDIVNGWGEKTHEIMDDIGSVGKRIWGYVTDAARGIGGFLGSLF